MTKVNQVMQCCHVAGSQVSGSSDDDQMSDWGNDAAVYSSDSELSDWEQPDALEAASVRPADMQLQAEQEAAGELPLLTFPYSASTAFVAIPHEPCCFWIIFIICFGITRLLVIQHRPMVQLQPSLHGIAKPPSPGGIYRHSHSSGCIRGCSTAEPIPFGPHSEAEGQAGRTPTQFASEDYPAEGLSAATSGCCSRL